MSFRFRAGPLNGKLPVTCNPAGFVRVTSHLVIPLTASGSVVRSGRISGIAASRYSWSSCWPAWNASSSEMLENIALAGRDFGDRIRKVLVLDGDALRTDSGVSGPTLQSLGAAFPKLHRVSCYATVLAQSSSPQPHRRELSLLPKSCRQRRAVDLHAVLEALLLDGDRHCYFAEFPAGARPVKLFPNPIRYPKPAELRGKT